MEWTVSEELKAWKKCCKHILLVNDRNCDSQVKNPFGLVGY